MCIDRGAPGAGSLRRRRAFEGGLISERRSSDSLSTGNAPLCGQPLIMTDRTTLRLSDERLRLLEQASEIVADGPTDDPPRSDVIDAALTHLIESQENLEDVRDRYPPQEVKDCCNTSVLGLRYRTSIESTWR